MRLLDEALLRLLVGFNGLQTRTKDEHGQTLAEYGLILAVIAVAVVVVAVVAFRDQLTGAFNAAKDCLDGTC